MISIRLVSCLTNELGVRWHTDDASSLLLRSHFPFPPKEHRPKTYFNEDCPSIVNPGSDANFPIINTLLSISFSLLHNLPQMCRVAPASIYQQQLIAMGFEIIRMWLWDPPPEMKTNSCVIQMQNYTATQQNDTSNAKPKPIHHPSRKVTTFPNSPHTAFGAPTTRSSSRTLKQPLGPIVLGTPTHLARIKDEGLVPNGPLFAVWDEGLTKEEGLQRVDESIIAGIVSSR